MRGNAGICDPEPKPLCHPDSGMDCYTLVTVYGHGMPCDCAAGDVEPDADVIPLPDDLDPDLQLMEAIAAWLRARGDTAPATVVSTIESAANHLEMVALWERPIPSDSCDDRPGRWLATESGKDVLRDLCERGLTRQTLQTLTWAEALAIWNRPRHA